jgi:hypothetical protein
MLDLRDKANVSMSKKFAQEGNNYLNQKVRSICLTGTLIYLRTSLIGSITDNI